MPFNCSFSTRDVFSDLNETLGWGCLPLGPFQDNVVNNLNDVKDNCSSEELVKYCIVWWFIWSSVIELLLRSKFLYEGDCYFNCDVYP